VWSYFGAVWLLVLLAFLLGVLLSWLFWVRPLQRQRGAEPATGARRPPGPGHAAPAQDAPAQDAPAQDAPAQDAPDGPAAEQAGAYDLAEPDADAGLGILTDRGVEEAPAEPALDAENPWDWAFTEGGGWQRENPALEGSEQAPFGPGSAQPSQDGSAPSAQFTVKARTSSMVFHTSDSPFYENLRPQVWFTDPETATRAGFTDWERPAEAGAEQYGEDGAPPG
jgi:hypothetical protein